MAHLVIRAASGYYSDAQKHVMQLGSEELSDQIKDIVDSTQFNPISLVASVSIASVLIRVVVLAILGPCPACPMPRKALSDL